MIVRLIKHAETEAQGEVLLNFLESHPSMVSEIINSPDNPIQLWNDLANLLNPLGPPSRTGIEWYRAYEMLVYSIQLRARKMLRDGTSMDPNQREPVLSTLENRFLALMGGKATEGEAPSVDAVPGPSVSSVVPLENIPTTSFAMVQFLYSIGDTDLDLIDVTDQPIPIPISNKFLTSAESTINIPILHCLRDDPPPPFELNFSGTKLYCHSTKYALQPQDEKTPDRLVNERYFRQEIRALIFMQSSTFQRWKATYPHEFLKRMICHTAATKVVAFRKKIQRKDIARMQKKKVKRESGDKAD